MNRFIRKITACSAAAVLACSALGLSAFADDEWDELDQAQFTQAMGLGWNLGNTFEALRQVDKDGDGQKDVYEDYWDPFWDKNNMGTPYVLEPWETGWNNTTPVTEELIKTVKDAGFSSIRMPVGWLTHIGDKESGYEIEQAWLDRIHEVINWCVDNDIFVIVNMHSDGYHTISGGWLLCDAPDEEQVEIKAKYQAVWSQIADEFKDFDEHLIFESMNEEFNGYYSGVNNTAYENINDYNQIFVDAVRATGGNNTKRWLLIPGWNTDINATVSNKTFRIPTDEGCTSDSNRIAISVHFYDPYDFVLNEGNTNCTQWGQYAQDGKNATWGQEDHVETQFKKLKSAFTSKGYPVIVGEFSPTDKTSYDDNNEEFRRYWCEVVVKAAKENGCIPVYWDNGAIGKGGCAVIDRPNLTVAKPDIVEAMVRAMNTEGDYDIPAVNPTTQDENYKISPVGHLILVGGGETWYPRTGLEDGNVAADINVEYGENTFTYKGFTLEDGTAADFSDPIVFVIDLQDCAAKLNDIKISNIKVTCDGVELPVDQAKVVVGDPEGKNNVRIEIYNIYGETKDAPAIDVAAMKASDEIVVSFTAESKHLFGYEDTDDSSSKPEESSAPDSDTEDGRNEDSSSADSSSKTDSSSTAASSSSKAASTDSTSNPNTGAAAGLAAVAVSIAGAVVVKRKRV